MCQGYISNKASTTPKRTHAFQFLLLIRSSNFFTQTLKQRHLISELINTLTPLSSVCLLALQSFPFLIPNHFSHLMRKAQFQGHREAPVNRKLVAPQHQGFTSSAELQNHNDESKESCLLALGHRIMLRLNQMLAGPGR